MMFVKEVVKALPLAAVIAVTVCAFGIFFFIPYSIMNMLCVGNTLCLQFSQTIGSLAAIITFVGMWVFILQKSESK